MINWIYIFVPKQITNKINLEKWRETDKAKPVLLDFNTKLLKKDHTGMIKYVKFRVENKHLCDAN